MYINCHSKSLIKNYNHASLFRNPSNNISYKKLLLKRNKNLSNIIFKKNLMISESFFGFNLNFHSGKSYKHRKLTDTFFLKFCYGVLLLTRTAKVRSLNRQIIKRKRKKSIPIITKTKPIKRHIFKQLHKKNTYKPKELFFTRKKVDEALHKVLSLQYKQNDSTFDLGISPISANLGKKKFYKSIKAFLS